MNLAQDDLVFPLELCRKPTALICLSGLDVKNQLHNTIWESFSKNYEKSCVSFKSIPVNHKFPVVKSKKSSYERYIPKGILKRHWLKKHTEEVPSVVVILYDLDWDDLNWELKKNECASIVLSLKAALEGRFTRFAVILVQRKVSLPAVDDVAVADKAAAICAACELNSKWLFVLSQGDHLQGCIIRVETALHELAQTYYTHEIKQLKLHKDRLNQTTHQYLFVRHQFKMGFMCEQKQEIITAQKHYLQAYIYMKEVRLVETNIYEVKLIAGFINYKLCQLLFKLNQAKDAISQFRTHIEFFKNKFGQKELLFEHYSWLSKQYFMFGEVFDDAIRLGLTAVQTQHPGYYYKSAAEQSMQRKTLCLQLCANVSEADYPRPDPLQNIDKLEFYGQRPWRAGKLSAEPADIVKEKQGILALQLREKLVDHSSVIISQLGNSISQFKTFKCPRMRRRLVVLMADEYYQSQDYGKALTLLSHMLWDYRSENWCGLMSSLLSRALSCAYLSANLQDYLTLSFESLGPSVQLASQHKMTVLDNILLILRKEVPKPVPEVPQEQFVTSEKAWRNLLQQDLSVTIEMGNIATCIDVKVLFTSDKFLLGEKFTFDVYVRFNMDVVELEFSQLSVLISNSKKTEEITVHTSPGGLLFTRDHVVKFSGTYTCDDVEPGTQVQINNVLLTMCGAEDRRITLKFTTANTSSGDALSNNMDANLFQLQHLRFKSNDSLQFDLLKSVCTTHVSVRECNVEFVVQHDSPALLGEWFTVHITVINQEEFIDLMNCNMDISLQGNKDDSTVEQSTQLCSNLDKCQIQSVVNVKLDDIKAKCRHVVTFYMRCHRIGDRNLVANLNYEACTDAPDKSTWCCSKRENITIPVIKPFEITSQILSMKCEVLDCCYSGESFLLSLNVQSLSPWPIVLHHSTMDLGLFVKPADAELKSLISGTVLEENETGTDMFVLKIEEGSEQAIALGTYQVKWCRRGNEQVIDSSVTVRTVKCENVQFSVDMSLPAHGWVKQPMFVQYNLYNHTSNLVQLNLIMDGTDGFMFAGKKQLQILLLPGSARQLEYILYPLFSGLVTLPRLVSTTIPDDKHQAVLDRNLPTHVYILPQEKKQSAVCL